MGIRLDELAAAASQTKNRQVLFLTRLNFMIVFHGQTTG
jgi:hypothetical protein